MAALPPLGAPLPPPDDLGGLPPEALGLPPEALGAPLPPEALGAPPLGPAPGMGMPGDDVGLMLMEMVALLQSEQQGEQDLLLNELLSSLGIAGAGPSPLDAGLAGVPSEALGLPPADLGAGPAPPLPDIGGAAPPPLPEDLLF